METRKIVQGKKQMAAAAAAAAAVRTGKHVRSMGSSSYYMEEGGEGAQLSTYVLGTYVTYPSFQTPGEFASIASI